MVRDTVADEHADPESVLEALEDEACREIIRALTEPMTAEEISEATDIPTSTTYRKLELLTDADLLEEGIEVRSDGQHASRYVVGFDQVVIALSEERELTVDISQTAETPDERLATLWSEVRKET